MRKHEWLYVFMSSAVLVFLGACGTLLAAVTAYEIPLDTGHMVGFSVLFSVYIALALSWKAGGKYLSLGGLAAILLLCLVRLKTLTAGLSNIVLLVRNRLSIAMPFISAGTAGTELTMQQTQQADMLAMLLLLYLMCYFLAWSIIRAQSFSLSAVASTPLFVLSLVYTDYPPSAFALCLILGYWALLFLTYIVRRGNLLQSAKLTLLLTPLVLLLVAGAYLGVSKMDPVPVIPLDKVEEKLESLFSQTAKTVAGTRIAAMEKEELDAIGEKDQSQAVVMRVKGTSGGKMYLRGYSLASYTGEAWLAAREYADAGANRSAALPYLAYAGVNGTENAQTMEVEYVNATALLHLPYYIAPPGDAIVTEEQAWMADRRQVSYHCQYLPIVGVPAASMRLSDADAAWEAGYRAYVHDAYTQLDGAAREQLLLLADQAGIDRSADAYTLARAVASYVRGAAAYDLYVDPMPDGSDFVLHFLTENRRGYCVHFASAATAMLQALGVPARYVSGYMVNMAADTWTDVTVADAHAWTEVYVDGLGWFPIEATASAAPDPTEELTAEPTMEPTPEPTAEPTPEPTPEAPGEGGQTTEPTMEPTAEPDDGADGGAEEPQEGQEDTQDSDTEQEEPPPSLLWLLWIFVPLLVALLFLLRRSVIVSAREQRLRRKSPNRSVIAAYAYLKQLSAAGVACPEWIEAVALEAAFSNHTLTAEQRKAVLTYLYGELDTLRARQTRAQRFIARYIRVWY